MEYPFAQADALAYKVGYDDVESDIKCDAQAQFSLVDSGIFNQDCTRFLLMNGTRTASFWFEDSVEIIKHGMLKIARFISGRGHMGAPEAEAIIRNWLLAVFSASRNHD
jgi:hypothetical protein